MRERLIREMAARAAENSHQPIVVLSFGRKLLWQNQAAAALAEKYKRILPGIGYVDRVNGDVEDFEPKRAKIKLGNRVFEWTITTEDRLAQTYYIGKDVTEEYRLEKERQRLTRELERERELRVKSIHDSLHDPLTGLPNKRYFEQKLVESCKIEDPNSSIALLIFDLDHFSNVNDYLGGHPVGDRVLAEVASRLQEVIRHDFIARTGGEEFSALLTFNEQKSEAEKITVATHLYTAVQNNLRRPIRLKYGKRRKRSIIRKFINSDDFRLIVSDPEENSNYLDLHLTLSAGVACRRRGERKQRLYERADDHLYLAKEFGRNQLVSHDCS